MARTGFPARVRTALDAAQVFWALSLVRPEFGGFNVLRTPAWVKHSTDGPITTVSWWDGWRYFSAAVESEKVSDKGSFHYVLWISARWKEGGMRKAVSIKGDELSALHWLLPTPPGFKAAPVEKALEIANAIAGRIYNR